MAHGNKLYTVEDNGFNPIVQVIEMVKFVICTSVNRIRIGK